ncbi:protein ALP1-like [Xenia sp. Carnegie-2017]|uniref:protein ALP1-like n=1 Tax=Xenia sp. Carnegie-2017 TaxID=2897299 RepID=UPI001F0342B7|nr:protein ALP1-like [Xenia sp. Carnegie-2017]
MAKTKIAQRQIIFMRHMLERAKNRRRMLDSFIQLLINRRIMAIRAAITLILCLFSQNSRSTSITPRSCRRLARNKGWWNLIWVNYSAVGFKKTFRISRETFLFILARLRHVLEKKNIVEEPLPPEVRLAVCLYRLGRGTYYYTIAELTGLGVSTVCSITDEVCKAIVEQLWDELVKQLMPQSEQDFKDSMIDMEHFWQFPCCWAALDGCHISIKCPPGGQEANKEYHNFKNFYSIVLMALVDSHYRFIWGSCGYPGNSHDSIIFQSTQLWASIQEGNYLPAIGKVIGQQTVQPLIVADSAFPFTKWLMKPYTDAVLSERKRYFNYRLSRAQMVTEGAFGQLKGRWHVLYRKCESNRKSVRMTVLACLVLHKICLMKKDTISKKLDLSQDPGKSETRDRDSVRELLQMRACPKVRDTSKEAADIRNALVEKLWLEETGEVV